MSVIRAASLLAAGALVSASAGYALTAGGGAPVATKNLGTGKQLYRKYCGQCHALRAALAAGFGSDNGLGTNGGPSFDKLRVPFNLSVLAVTQPFIGHEMLVHKMTWAQIQKVSKYVASVTRKHSVVAQKIDG
jgi:mono/diheme cytochrome c family protein